MSPQTEALEALLAPALAIRHKSRPIAHASKYMESLGGRAVRIDDNAMSAFEKPPSPRDRLRIQRHLPLGNHRNPQNAGGQNHPVLHHMVQRGKPVRLQIRT